MVNTNWCSFSTRAQAGPAWERISAARLVDSLPPPVRSSFTPVGKGSSTTCVKIPGLAWHHVSRVVTFWEVLIDQLYLVLGVLPPTRPLQSSVNKRSRSYEFNIIIVFANIDPISKVPSPLAPHSNPGLKMVYPEPGQE